MSNSPPPEPPPASSTDDVDPATTSSPNKASSTRAKLLKIPQIPVRRNARDEDEDSEEEDEEEEDDDDDEDDEDEDTRSRESSFILPSSLGLNHIRTRSAPSPLRFSSSDAATLNLGVGDDSSTVKCAVEPKAKLTIMEQGNPKHFFNTTNVAFCYLILKIKQIFKFLFVCQHYNFRYIPFILILTRTENYVFHTHLQEKRFNGANQNR